jgi:hypothetical protein
MASILSLESLAFRELVVRHGADITNMDSASVDERSARNRSTGKRQASALEELTFPDGRRDRAHARSDPQ